MSLLGITKGTDIEEEVAHLAESERQRVGMYHALVRLAKEQDQNELAKELVTLAADETRHAGLYTVLNGDVQHNIFAVLRYIVEAEIISEEKLESVANKIRKLGLESVAREVEAAAIEKGQHVVVLKELIKKYKE